MKQNWVAAQKAYFALSALSLLILLYPFPAQPQASNSSEIDAHSTAAVQCPSTDFHVFLNVFTESIRVQESFTRFPLEKLEIDVDADPEPKQVIKSLDRSRVSFPVIPDSVERARDNLAIRFDGIGSSEAEVILRKEDTDYQVTYSFMRNGCWKLIRITDSSL